MHAIILVVEECPMATEALEVNWQEAVARLAHERTLAVTCVALLKKHGDASAIDRGALAANIRGGQPRPPDTD